MEGGDSRIASLATAVKRALSHMQRDGLAQQLEMSKTSCQYVPRRLTEVLRDYIESRREKEIQRVLHETDNIAFERDKLELKLEKLKTEQDGANRAARAEHRRLNKIKHALFEKICEAKQQQVQHTAKFENAIIARQRHIRNTNVVLARSKVLLSSFAAELSELRADVILNSATSTRTVRSAFNRIKAEAGRRLHERGQNAKRAVKKQIRAKTAEVESIRAQTEAIKTSLADLHSFILGMAPSPTSTPESSDATSIRQLLSQILDAQEEQAIQGYISKGGQSLTQLVRTRKGFVKSARKILEGKLNEKKQELDELITHARKRRLKLQEKLDAALEQLRSLQGSRISEDTLSSTGPQFDFESTTKQLDATLNQLGRELAKETSL